VLLIQGKGRDEKDNFVLLTDKTYQPIADYLASRGKVNSSEALFTSTSNNSKGEGLTTRSISYIAKEGLKAIGLDERAFTAHSLRHTTAVNILRAGGSLETAQFTLRHSNPATTQIYTATLNEERRLLSSGEALIDSLY
jgi:integrase/recombinase XerC/integrase/recombinase XerD